MGFLLFCFVLSAIFGAIGARMFLYQNGLEVDQERRLILNWTRNGGGRKDKVIKLDDQKFVKISSRGVERRDFSGRIILDSSGQSAKRCHFFQVEVVDQAGEGTPMVLCPDYTQARRQGERLAKAAKLSLHDHSSSPVVVREYDKLNQNLGERLALENIETELSEPPEDSSLSFKTVGDKSLILLPKVGYPGMVGALATVLLGGPLTFLVYAFSRANSVAVLCTVGPCLLFAVLNVYNSLTLRMIEVDEEQLLIRQTDGFRRTLGCMKISELEELTIGSDSLICRSDRQQIDIPLRDSREVIWLRKTLEHIILNIEKRARKAEDHLQ